MLILGIREPFLSFSAIDIWVGGFSTNKWQWVNGESITFGWAHDEPSGMGAHLGHLGRMAEGCVQMYRGKSYDLNDCECNYQCPFICESRGKNMC